MTTQAQIVANQNNSLKAGVKTKSGKEISKYNAMRHKILRKTLIANEQIEAQEIHDCLISKYTPNDNGVSFD